MSRITLLYIGTGNLRNYAKFATLEMETPSRCSTIISLLMGISHSFMLHANPMLFPVEMQA